jgi:adenosine deaminase
MNRLVTTLGMSWQIVPELYGFTNPNNYDFFHGNAEAGELRQQHRIESVDELWVITVAAQRDLDKLRAWAEQWHVRLHLLICEGINEFANQREIETMRSFIYRTVLNARGETAVKVYLSLTGGRKTMSADMQEAGNLFGCDAMLHIVDLNLPKEIRDQINTDTLLGSPGAWATHYMPVLVSGPIEASMVIAAGDKRLAKEDYPLLRQANDRYCEDGALAQEIVRRKQQSSQLYANFYQRLGGNTDNNERNIFRKLYFLHPDVVSALKNVHPDADMLRQLPKADLHTHLGGVLSAQEIIDTARAENPALEAEVLAAVACGDLAKLQALRKCLFDNKEEKNFTAFYPRFLAFIAAFADKPHLFDQLVSGEFADSGNYHGIGIEQYQKLGDFQGSSLLQTKATLAAAVHAYAEKLKDDNVRYVEIRCSPYKYTRMSLSESEVVNSIMDVLDGYREYFDYRLIIIIGRQAKIHQLLRSIASTLELMETNIRFRQKLAGIDLAGSEGARKPSELRAYFMPFLQQCLRITIHAGETESAENIWEAVYHLSADRIGHGLKLIEHSELLERFVDKHIGIEMCPSSNDQIVGFRNEPYPLKDYMNAGLKVSLNTDNVGISRTTLSNEFMKAAELCGGLSLWECLVLIRNSLITAFIDTKTQKHLLNTFENDIHDWCLANKNALLS